MARDIIGEIIFWATLVLALVLYWLTAPTGLPWNSSSELALAYGGYIKALPHMDHSLWGYFVQVFNGNHIALSSVAMALAGGLVGALANRYFGWRIGVAAALTWAVLPPVWTRAVTGAYGAFALFGIVLGVWIANVIFLFVTRRARWNMWAARKSALSSTLTGFEQEPDGRLSRNRLMAWTLLGASIIFAVFSVGEHDYAHGEVASAYARVMLDEAGDRLVILNGVADDQMIWEAERREPGSSERLVLFRDDAAYRTQLVSRVMREWPAETNLWIAAEVGPAVFAEQAVRLHPERLYVMTGHTTSPEKWAARWEAMKPYLDSGDPFVPTMRRAFAFEGNTLGNRLQKEDRLKEAWTLYWHIVNEVDRENVSAVINLGEMVRRGYSAKSSLRKYLENRMEEHYKSLKGERAAKMAAVAVASCGPVISDSQVLAEYCAQIERRMAENEQALASGKWRMPAELRSLMDLSDEMLKAHDRGDIETAARIARTILARPGCHDYVPANAILGTAMSVEGNYAASEAFYRVAIEGSENPPVVICNDYADTLRHLKCYDEAEKYARRAVEATDDRQWVFRLTLVEVLRDAKKNPEEIKQLLGRIRQHAPYEMRDRLRQEFK